MNFRFKFSEYEKIILDSPGCTREEDGTINISEEGLRKAFYTLSNQQLSTFDDKLVSGLMALDTIAVERKYDVEFFHAVAVLISFISTAVAESYDVDHADPEDSTLIFSSEEQIQLQVLMELTAFAKAQRLDLRRILFDGNDCGMESYAADRALQDWADTIRSDRRLLYMRREETKSLEGFVTELGSLTKEDLPMDTFYDAIDEIWGTLSPGNIEQTYNMIDKLTHIQKAVCQINGSFLERC